MGVYTFECPKANESTSYFFKIHAEDQDSAVKAARLLNPSVVLVSISNENRTLLSVPDLATSVPIIF